MEKQFTSSEVRAEAHRHANEVEDMLNAFADLLEAQEKAVPVYQHRSKNGPLRPWFDCSEEIFMAMEHNEHDREHFDRRVLYTHPAPSDAERLEPPSNLQEALCVIENAALHGVTLHGDDIPRLRATVDRIAPAQQSQDAERLAEALRKIVEWNPPMTTDHEGKPASMSLMYGSNGVRDYFRNVAREALAAHSAQAQPPAASVTDAMIMRAVKAWTSNGFGNPGQVFSIYSVAKVMLEAALAAQENPNGL